MMRPQVKGSYSAPALERAFDVFEVLASRPDGALITDIAAQLGRTLPELFRVIVVMEAAGYLQKCDTTGRYLPTFRLLEMAYRATPARRLVEASTNELHTLARDTLHSCCLVVANGLQGLVIASIEAPADAGFAFKVGSSLALLDTAAGAILAAFDVEGWLGAAWLAADRSCADGAINTVDYLSSVRSKGFETMPNSMARGVTDLSFPVFDASGIAVAALTLPLMKLADDSNGAATKATFRKALAASHRMTRLVGSALGYANPVLR